MHDKTLVECDKKDNWTSCILKEEHKNKVRRESSEKGNIHAERTSRQCSSLFWLKQTCLVPLQRVTASFLRDGSRFKTFFNVRQTSIKSPGAIFFVNASLVSSAKASFLSDHFDSFLQDSFYKEEMVNSLKFQGITSIKRKEKNKWYSLSK